MYKEIHKGAVAKSYIRKGFLVYDEEPGEERQPVAAQQPVAEERQLVARRTACRMGATYCNETYHYQLGLTCKRMGTTVWSRYWRVGRLASSDLMEVQ
jgi:hypothetical protein